MTTETGVGHVQTLKMNSRATRSALQNHTARMLRLSFLCRPEALAQAVLCARLRSPQAWTRRCRRLSPSPCTRVFCAAHKVCVRSKYKVLEPTKVADLVKHNVPSYKEPKSDELDNLSDGDLVKVCLAASNTVSRPTRALRISERHLLRRSASSTTRSSGVWWTPWMAMRTAASVRPHTVI